jgi:hypothetical protein
MTPADAAFSGYPGSPEQAMREAHAELGRLIELLKLERAAIHQTGDADAKLLELRIDEQGFASPTPNQPRRVALLQQKLDGTRRLTAARVEQATLRIGQYERQALAIAEMVRRQEAMLFTPAGTKAS